jgi:hypothetical protein
MIVFIIIFSILPLSQNTFYSSVTGGAEASFAGVWKGDSVCQIKDSPCHDEVSVVLRVEGRRTQQFPDEDEQDGRP